MSAAAPSVASAPSARVQFPGVEWLGLCDTREEAGRQLADETSADFFTTSFDELLGRPEVNAAMILTDENNHTAPTLAAVDRGLKLLIEKPLATDARESAQVLAAIEAAGVDACMCYTQRFRRRFLTIKERLTAGQIGEVHSVITRALMNRMVPIATIEKTRDRRNLTPMVVSGTHSLDMSMWLMEGKTPVSVYARSTDKVLARLGTKDSTFGLFTMDDGTIFLHEHKLGAAGGLAGGRLRYRDRHRRHQGRDRRGGHAS